MASKSRSRNSDRRAPPSKISALPGERLKDLQRDLSDPGMSQTEAARRLNRDLEADGLEPVSLMAVNRYDKRMRESARHVRQAREAAKFFVGESKSEHGGDIGHVAIEVLRVMSWDMADHMQRLADRREIDPESMRDMVEDVKNLALALQRLERASDVSERRELRVQERKLREEERRQAADTAAKALKRAGKGRGLTEETIDEIRREILGIEGE